MWAPDKCGLFTNTKTPCFFHNTVFPSHVMFSQIHNVFFLKAIIYLLKINISVTQNSVSFVISARSCTFIFSGIIFNRACRCLIIYHVRVHSELKNKQRKKPTCMSYHYLKKSLICEFHLLSMLFFSKLWKPYSVVFSTTRWCCFSSIPHNRLVMYLRKNNSRNGWKPWIYYSSLKIEGFC